MLHDAVVAYDRATEAPEASPAGDARWSLLDVFHRDGSQYVVARRDNVAGKRTLTKRERELVAHAAVGQHNKLIAYTLGISHATVRVLIARAAKRLGVRTRAELIAKFLELNDPLRTQG
jgi:DNA-binding CsgD family transcriptional regulator